MRAEVSLAGLLPHVGDRMRFFIVFTLVVGLIPF